MLEKKCRWVKIYLYKFHSFTGENHAMEIDDSLKEKAIKRLQGLLDLQKEVEMKFGEKGYNVFIFGSYITVHFQEGKSDIDIAIYSKDFDLYKRLACYLEEFFNMQGIKSDIFYIDTSIAAPVYCAPLNSKIQFTDYYPSELYDFNQECQRKLNELKERAIG